MKTIYSLDQTQGFAIYEIDETKKRVTIYNQYGDWVDNVKIETETKKGFHLSPLQFLPNSKGHYLKKSQLTALNMELPDALILVKKQYEEHIDFIINSVKE